VGSLLTILLGFWAPLGHLLHWPALQVPALEHWLAPALPGAREVALRQTAPGAAVEWLLIFASVAVALGGFFVARRLVQGREEPGSAR